MPKKNILDTILHIQDSAQQILDLIAESYEDFGETINKISIEDIDNLIKESDDLKKNIDIYVKFMKKNGYIKSYEDDKDVD